MKYLQNFFFDDAARPGLGFMGIGTLLNIIHRMSHEDALYYASLFSLLTGGSYYVIKIIFIFIKKDKE